MCGRFALGLPGRTLRERFQTLDEPTGSLDRWNVAPGTAVWIVVPGQGGRRFVEARWGLVPGWAEDERIGWKLINVRSETAAVKPAFRGAVRRRRCLVPASGFYEWRRAGRRKEPWFFRLREEAPLALAGIWESWTPKGRPDAPPLLTCAVLTTAANALVAPVHDRMPVIVDPADFALWLGETGEGEAPAALLGAYPADRMRAWPVSPAVNRADNEGPELVRPLAKREESEPVRLLKGPDGPDVVAPRRGRAKRVPEGG